MDPNGEALMDRILEGLSQQFKIERDLRKLEPSELFESFCTFSVLRTLFEEEFDPEDFRLGGGGDLGIDAAAVIVNGDLLIEAADVRAAVENARSVDAHFVLIQAKSATNFEGKVIADLADNLVDLFSSKQISYPASADLQNLKEAIEEVYKDLGKLKQLPRLSVHYATSGQVTDDEHLEQKRKSATDRLDGENLFLDVSFNLLGSRELRELYQRATNAVSTAFSMQKRISLPRIPGVEQAFLGLLPATDLVKIITDASGGIRKSVFYENVRDFQDYNPVNAEIRKTLQDIDRRERFAVLNNGVTIVAREIKSAGDDLRITDFQIVNGCQTCHVLFDEQERLGSAVWISVKLIESRDDDVIAGITTATNRQTAVSDEDLEAKEQFHKDLEELFKSYPAPERLYYERRSGQYGPQHDLEKTRIVTRGQLTRAYGAVFLDEASKAGRFYKDLRESRKNDLYAEGQSTTAYYTAASVAYRVEWLLRNKKIDRKYAPAKYHIMSALKMYVMGEKQLERSKRKAERQCKELLALVWDAQRSTAVMESIIGAVDRAIEVGRTGELLRDFMRSQKFTTALNREMSRIHRANRKSGQ